MHIVPKAISDAIEAMHLPSPPQILLRFLAMAEDERTSISELASLVGQDPSLSSQILTLANSAAFRRDRKPTKCLTQCLVTLGTRLARVYATCLLVRRHFSPVIALNDYDLNGFWGHSLVVAEVCRTIAEETWYPDAEEAYLAGLLHDVGYLLLRGGVGDQYGSLLSLCQDEYSLYSLEGYRLDTNHAAVSAWMVNQWGLPDSFLSDAVMFHHAPAEQIVAADKLSRIVWSAHQICKKHELATVENTQQPPPEFAVLKTMHSINLKRADEIYADCFERVTLIAKSLGMSDTAYSAYSFALPVNALLPRNNSVEPLKTSDGLDIKIRDLALMQALQNNLASAGSEAELLLGIHGALRVFLALEPTAFMLIDQEQQSLKGAGADFQPPLLKGIEIPLERTHSLAARSAVDRLPCWTDFPEACSNGYGLVDIQIARILGTDGILYLPLNGRRQTLGIIVCGMHRNSSAHLISKLGLMTDFAQVIAATIEAWREQQSMLNAREQSLAKAFDAHTRKIVHEAGNPLGIINNYLTIIAARPSQNTELIQETLILKDEIRRVTEILQKIHCFQEVDIHAGSLDVNLELQSIIMLYGETLFSSRGISIRLDLPPGLPMIKSDRDSFRQIILNLCNNAADAMEDGGEFHLLTGECIDHAGRNNIEVRLSDTGSGIPLDIFGRLFSPLDPERRPGHAGIGLSIVAALVERLAGRITCQSRPGQGTIFSILLPVHGEGNKREQSGS